ncbi:hypothetical protein [Labilibacter marinus]|uniref:hypothetical protein n=1 Tax=Labilibacter marinus TaxID=1477105 RepID=UPI0008335BB1|nr:hypothetical protein [Labilibacter marinus]
MDEIITINKQSTREEIIDILVNLFSPYAAELLNSGGDFSYMNMYADNFSGQLQKQTDLSDEAIFEILNEACDLSWKRQSNG